MNKRVRQAALELMLLQEKFTKKELNDAVALVSNGENESLIELLSAQPATAPSERRKPKGQSKNGLSRAVQDLKDTDPQRYELLAEFEGMLRRETILPTLEDVRKVGMALSKSFQAGKSRKETISRLMTVLVPMPLEVLRKKLCKIIDESQSASNDDNSYQRLASFLINGSQTK